MGKTLIIKDADFSENAIVFHKNIITLNTGIIMPQVDTAGNYIPLDSIVSQNIYIADSIVIVGDNRTYNIKGVGGNKMRMYALYDKNKELVSIAEPTFEMSYPDNPFEVSIFCPNGYTLIINLYNGIGNPPYGNNNNIPYEVYYLDD